MLDQKRLCVKMIFRFKKNICFLHNVYLPGEGYSQKVAPYTKNILQAETIVNKNSFFQ